MKQGYDKPLWQGPFPLDCNSWGRCQKVSLKPEIICRLNRRAHSETSTSAVLLNDEMVQSKAQKKKKRFFDYPRWMHSSITVSAFGFSRDVLVLFGWPWQGNKLRKIFSRSPNAALTNKESKAFPVSVRVHLKFWQLFVYFIIWPLIFIQF